MKYKFQVRRYGRVFKKPLITSRFILKERKGLIIRLENEEGRVGFGEIAPLEFFGSESLEEAEELCNKARNRIDDAFIKSIDCRKGCCRFAFEMAREMMEVDCEEVKVKKAFDVAALIDLDFNGDVEGIKEWEKYRTFKCKIGRLEFEKEKIAFMQLREKLPKEANLRLDANGALSRKEAQKWLKFLESYPIQFLEQPLAKGEEQVMLELGKDYSTPIALDESIVNVDDFERLLEDWTGFFVFKPSLIGDIRRFRKLREQCERPIVYSSVFETGVGAEALLRIAASDKRNDYAIGFGTNAYFFDDGFSMYEESPVIHYNERKIEDIERIWNLCV